MRSGISNRVPAHSTMGSNVSSCLCRNCKTSQTCNSAAIAASEPSCLCCVRGSRIAGHGTDLIVVSYKVGTEDDCPSGAALWQWKRDGPMNC